MIKKYYITGFLVLSLIFGSFLPVFAPRAKALFGGGIVFDPIHNASTIFQTTLTLADMIARAVAQVILQRMIESTVNWANTGFEGNPAYVTDPKLFFTNIADDIAGGIISGSDLSFLCTPFQDRVRLAIYTNYINSGGGVNPQNRYQCSLSGVVNNIDAFYSDFSQGGWQGWFTMTQRSSNNPYGAYLEAQIDLDQRIAERLNLQREQLGWDSGFLSWAECTRTDPNTGSCIERGPTITPGSVIAQQLNRVLPSNMERFINAQHLEDLIAAFVTAALNRYVFGSDGLFSGNPPPARVPPPPPPPTSGADPIQACMNTCMNLYCPSGDPNSSNCNQPALTRCMNNCAGFSGPTPTPIPGPGGPGLPVVTLNAERIVARFITFASLDWTATNATSCTASGGWSGAKAFSGSETVRVNDPVMTFILTCFNANGGTSASVSVQR